MTAIIHVNGLWEQFGEYLCNPYKNNPVHRADVEAWFNNLYAHHEPQDIRLSHHTIVHRDNPDLFFEVFSLCGQMFFSTSPFVKTFPCPHQADVPNRHPEKRVGIHLKDYGSPDRAFERFKEDQFSKISKDHVDFRKFVFEPGGTESAYLLTITGKIRADHRAAFVAGLSPEDIASIEIRFAKLAPRGAMSHRDFKVEKLRQSHFSRSHLYAFDPASTLYDIRGRWIACPPHASASHYASFSGTNREEEKGVSHRAQTCPQGRAVLVIAEGFRPTADVKNPWRVETSPLVPA